MKTRIENLPNLGEILTAIQKFDVEKFASLAENDDYDDLNWTNSDDGYNPFLIALKTFGEKISGIPLNEKSNEEQIAEIEGFGKKATSIISIFLENGVNVNCETVSGLTPLGCVKYYLYLGMLSFLPSAMDGKADEKKVVMQSLSNFFDGITAILVEAGADEKRKNKFGETPSQYADRAMTEGIEKGL